MEDQPIENFEVVTDSGQEKLVKTITSTETQVFTKQELLEQKGSLESALADVNQKLTYFTNQE